MATSLAVLQACAAARGLLLWQHLAAGDPGEPAAARDPGRFRRGAHAGRRVDIQDFMVMLLGATSFAQALEMTAEVRGAAGALMQAAGKRQGVADEGGYWPVFAANDEALGMLVRAIEHVGPRPGRDMAISLDIAASEFGEGGRYRLGLETRELDTAQLIELLGGWLDAYPIVSIEDPLAEDDEAGMVEFTRRFGRRVQIIGDDYLVTAAARIDHRRGIAGLQLRADQAQPGGHRERDPGRSGGRAARRLGHGDLGTLGRDRDAQAIAHLAVGWNAGTEGGPVRPLRAHGQVNECLRIKEALGARARFAGRTALAID